ncbi:helix-turn-helix domain-containing protein [Plantactinospora solaniradicis]|uniref:Helix-turn-helix domain-containing protein n=1 Tax=Plantactinospora solaniradicis TaxID=1723736 RepID=A0ABW1K619_9ACTN
MSDSETSELMTTEQVAAVLNRPTGTLRQWRSLGKGPRGWFRIEGRVAYPRTEVDRYLEEAKASSPHPAPAQP